MLSYSETYTQSMKIVTDNNLKLQNVLSKLLDYIRFDFSTLNSNDLLKNLSTPIEPTKIENKEETVVVNTIVVDAVEPATSNNNIDLKEIQLFSPTVFS